MLTVSNIVALENHSGTTWLPDKSGCNEAVRRMLDVTWPGFDDTGCVSAAPCCPWEAMPAGFTAGGWVEMQDNCWLMIDPNDK
jgi:hypothetical protein